MDALSLEQLEKSYEVRHYKSPSQESGANILNTLQTARSQAVYDTALSIGIKGGMASQLEKINLSLQNRTKFLDKVYNFEPYLIYSRVVPPVITEARNLYNQDGDYSVRLSGVLYKIERQARIVSVAPNWREYLNFPQSHNVLNISSAVEPSNSQEKSLWTKAIRLGWNDGVEQANIMLNLALDRLNRDYIGILRFHRFVEEGKVTLPVLAASKIDVTKNNSSLILNEQLLRLTVLPDFSNEAGWKAKIIGHSKVTTNYSIQITKENPKKKTFDRMNQEK